MPTKALGSAGFTAAELASKVGVSTRTVRYYSTQRLLPAVTFRGPSTRYMREHLVYLAAACYLRRAQRLSLTAIRSQLTSLSLPEVERVAALLLPELAPPTVSSAPFAPSAPQPSLPTARSESWFRVTILPGLELHLHASASAECQALAQDLLERARGEGTR